MKNQSHFDSGWAIVGMSFVTMALVYGVWYSFSVFFVALLKEFNWSRSIGAGAFSLFMIVHGLTGIFAGAIMGGTDPRKVLLGGSLFLGAGLLLCSQIQTWYQFYIFFGILTGIGVAATGLIPNATIIQNTFKEKRGLVIGIISAGIGIGILACVPVLQFSIIHLGWRTTYCLMGIFIPATVMVMVLVFLNRFPKKSSLSSIKSGGTDLVVKGSPAVKRKEPSKPWTIQQAVSTKPFWLISVSFSLNGFITQSVYAHQVVFFVDQGVESLFASSIVGVIGLVSVGGKILWGYLSDKFGREIIFTMGITCMVCGMVLLIVFSQVHWSGLTYLYAIFFGMGYAVMAALSPLIAADFFEGKSYGGIFGTLMMLNGVGGAIGAWFAGMLYDQIKSYLPVFIILIIFTILSCLCIWKVAPRKIIKTEKDRIDWNK